MEDDTHDKLTKAYLEYFAANEKWETRRSYRTYYATLQALQKIHRLSKQRMQQNRALFTEIKARNKGEDK